MSEIRLKYIDYLPMKEFGLTNSDCSHLCPLGDNKENMTSYISSLTRLELKDGFEPFTIADIVTLQGNYMYTLLKTLEATEKDKRDTRNYNNLLVGLMPVVYLPDGLYAVCSFGSNISDLFEVYKTLLIGFGVPEYAIKTYNNVKPFTKSIASSRNLNASSLWVVRSELAKALNKDFRDIRYSDIHNGMLKLLEEMGFSERRVEYDFTQLH